MELDHLKKRDERNKLLRYNEFSAFDAIKGQKSAIEMTSNIKPGSTQNVVEATPDKPLRLIDEILAKAKAQQQAKSVVSKEIKFEGEEKPAKRVVSGVTKMQYGMFKKAIIDENDEEPAAKTSAKQLRNKKKNIFA